MEPKKFWNKKHVDYSSKKWIDKPTIFAQFSVKYFLKRGRLLELGAGQGQDSRYFTRLGFEVLATDFSSKALSLLKEKSKGGKLKIETQIVDLRERLPFQDCSFDIVYSHLALHFFDYNTTQTLFKEIARILKKGGIFATLLNTIDDPQVKEFEKIEEDYYQEPGKILKRYFSPESLRQFVDKKFSFLILDAKGETYKDIIKTLIRFVGRKI